MQAGEGVQAGGGAEAREVGRVTQTNQVERADTTEDKELFSRILSVFTFDVEFAPVAMIAISSYHHC